MQLLINENKSINYIINLENKLKDRLNLLQNEEKIRKNNFIVYAHLELRSSFYTVIPKHIKQSLTTLQNFDLFYQQYTYLHIC